MANEVNNNKRKKIVKKRKISYQKVFSFVSAGFIIGCCIFYGTRFLKLRRDKIRRYFITSCKRKKQ